MSDRIFLRLVSDFKFQIGSIPISIFQFNPDYMGFTVFQMYLSTPPASWYIE